MSIRRKASASPESSVSSVEASDPPHSENGHSQPKKVASSSPGYSMQQSSTPLLVVSVVLTLLYLANNTLSRLAFTRVITSLPVALSLYAGVRPGMQLYQRFIPLTLVMAVVGTHLPAFLACGISTVAVVVFSLATMPDPASTRLSKARGMPDFNAALRSTILMTVALLGENFLIWVLSATFEPGWNIETAPPPLQDNGKTLIKHFFSNLADDEVLGLRKMWNTQWVLVLCLGVSFFVVEIFHPVRSLYSVGTRAFLSIAILRFTRTVSFLLTVVPSQIEGCYDLRFPGSNPPPTEWQDWLWVGFLPRTKGGCNDLIISGHAIIMSTIACVATSVANDPLFSLALWSMVFLDYCVVVFEGLHYSVDMFLGVVLSSLLWKVLQPLESPSSMHVPHINTSLEKGNTLTIHNVIMYATPAVVAYLQLVVFPIWTANIVIMAYIVTALIIYFKFVFGEEKVPKKQPYMHLMQHVVICVLFMALGVYL